ncbi:hypothetical protein PPTG_21396 [Phytophthora nicotianae INRA-310]|uniref:Uncharacterized protein n=2 Tax=Phytophthora nicotianae TaxID=4792 RepID=W2R2T1_PHYN3|nr:hypothetical protein PPTG_21396 [Phytophthora nicotianae INRA-310]ETN19019.1 hypothetical protein PPTG_21396 [Phytophthora nicotianae INRA-310]ETO67759.1 hypothetical protein F444_15348 [Phytophthora nicotianae P1976]
MKDPTTEDIAKNLELLLLTRWLHEKKHRSPFHVGCSKPH